jgi:hypothetical protein
MIRAELVNLKEQAQTQPEATAKPAKEKEMRMNG